MKNKNKITIILGILLIGLVSAGVMSVSINLTDTKFTPKSTTELTIYEGLITFECGKVPMNLTMSEPDMNFDDDFEQVIGSYCLEEVSNVRDWTGRNYKENEFGLRSFDEIKLVKHACSNTINSTFNSTSKICEEIPEEMGEIQNE